jgi:hypothetical protein
MYRFASLFDFPMFRPGRFRSMFPHLRHLAMSLLTISLSHCENALGHQLVPICSLPMARLLLPHP